MLPRAQRIALRGPPAHCGRRTRHRTARPRGRSRRPGPPAGPAVPGWRHARADGEQPGAGHGAGEPPRPAQRRGRVTGQRGVPGRADRRDRGLRRRGARQVHRLPAPAGRQRTEAGRQLITQRGETAPARTAPSGPARPRTAAGPGPHRERQPRWPAQRRSPQRNPAAAIGQSPAAPRTRHCTAGTAPGARSARTSRPPRGPAAGSNRRTTWAPGTPGTPGAAA